jgi:hypothetical protein
VARRTIAAGEELTYDYSTSDTLGLEMTCVCGTAKCRGTVHGDAWRDPGFRSRNSQYLSLYIQELIAAERGQTLIGLPPDGLPSPLRPGTQTPQASPATDVPSGIEEDPRPSS